MFESLLSTFISHPYPLALQHPHCHKKHDGKSSDLFIFNFHKGRSDWLGPSLPWFIPWLPVTCLPSPSFISSSCSGSRRPTSSCTKATRTSRILLTELTPAPGWASSRRHSATMTWVWLLAKLTFHTRLNYLLIPWLSVSRLSTRNWTTFPILIWPKRFSSFSWFSSQFCCSTCWSLWWVMYTPTTDILFWLIGWCERGWRLYSRRCLVFHRWDQEKINFILASAVTFIKPWIRKKISFNLFAASFWVAENNLKI